MFDINKLRLMSITEGILVIYVCIANLSNNQATVCTDKCNPH